MATIAGGTVSATDAGRRAPRGTGAFEVHLDVFEGPFDLLLGLISKHKLDITEVALSQVTDEFIAYIRQRSGGWDLDQVSYFLVVAATLLDLKAARLLPSGEVEDEEDLALLEARDLLFARLLQYRAYKEVAAVFAGPDGGGGEALPAARPARAAVRRAAARGAVRHRPAGVRGARRPGARPEGAAGGVDRPYPRRRSSRSGSRRSLIARPAARPGPGVASGSCPSGAGGNYEIVASFLALLELYREDVVAFEQVSPLGELYVTWTGGDREVAPGAAGRGAGAPARRPKREEEDYI